MRSTVGRFCERVQSLMTKCAVVVDIHASAIRRSQSWPSAIVEIAPELATRLPQVKAELSEFAQRALSSHIGAASTEIGEALVLLPNGRIGICLEDRAQLTRWLHEAATRRGTSIAEVLHCALSDAINASPPAGHS